MSCAGRFADENSARCPQALGVLAKINSVFLTSEGVQNYQLQDGVVDYRRVLSSMNTTIVERMLGRVDVSTLVSVEEGMAHPDDGSGPYRPLGVVHMDEPEPTKADAKPEQPSTPKLKSSVIKPLRLFPRRKRTPSPPDDASQQ
jgi:hypothetical protein